MSIGIASGAGSLKAGTAVSLTNQTTTLGPTAIFTPPAPGMYRLCGYAVCRTAGSGGASLAMTISYTDSVQAQNDTPEFNTPGQSANLNLTTIGNNGWFTMEFFSTAAAISYTATLNNTGAPAYDLYLRLEAL